MSLASAVDRIFSDDFLFAATNATWMASVVEPSTGKPKDVDPSLLLSFPTITINCASADNTQMLIELGKLVNSGATTNVVINKAADDNMYFRRKVPLDLNLHPDRRTVFVKPVHYGASEQQIKDFFSKWGAVERVERRQFAEGGSLKTRPSLFVVFRSETDAQHCVNAKPSYGKLDSDLGNLFVPSLTVLMKGAQDAIDEMEKPSGAAASSSATGKSDSTKFLQKGCSLQVKNMEPGTTWKDVKMKLGNLVLNQPGLKSKITLVFADNNTKRCFVFVKDPAAAQALALCYREAVSKTVSSEEEEGHRKFVEGLKQVVPSLDIVTDEKDEKWLQDRFVSFATEKVSAKQEKNRKRPRDE